MEAVHQGHNDNRAFFHFKRPRLNQLFTEAVRYPLVVVCAGAGYGKTSAVHDFVEEYQADIAWIQLSERDNVGTRFWENYTHTMMHVNAPVAEAMAKLGFPDTREKLNHFRTLLNNLVEMKRRIIVMDDFHYIEDPSVIHFLEEYLLRGMPPATTIFLISRSTPRINTAALIYRNQIFNMSESDLCFTESELSGYFHGLNISLQADSAREIMRDTEGWAFAINLIARSYQKTPKYGGYARNAMKANIFRFMETEIWDGISGSLQNFLVRLSLIDHLSVDLISQLSEGEEELIAGLERESAYVRQDSYINAYLIHHLFLEFLSTKQELLSEEEKRKTYAIAGAWCNENGFKIDSLSYYEKTGDYQAIISIMDEWPSQIPVDIAKITAVILDQAPSGVFDTVEFLALHHLRSYVSVGLLQKAIELAQYYEAKFLKLPDTPNAFKDRALGHLYFIWSILRGLMCVSDDRYDFDLYQEKFCKHIHQHADPNLFEICPAPWVVGIGSSGKGAPEEFIKALANTTGNYVRYFNGYRNGHEEIGCGELCFYRGDPANAESFINLGLNRAQEHKEFDLTHRAWFYIMRISMAQGNYSKTEQALKNTEAESNHPENRHANRYINYDISLSWYYCYLGLPEKTSEWLKEDFSPYSHAGFIENFGNQIKARYCYATRNYPPLLSYIEEMKRRESYLFGRVEMLAMEACIHYKMKDREKAFAALEEAYGTASPNEIVMPFIEMGKDMRTLTGALLKESGAGIPRPWLEDINRKSTSYANHRAHIIEKYMQANGLTGRIVLSPREKEILTDLSRGLSRTEIADNRDLSINTVKMVINSIYSKLGVRNLAGLIRIAMEEKLI